MKANAEGQVTKDTDGITGDARGEVRRFCRLRLDEVPRLDALARRLRSLNGETTDRIQRPDLLAVLHLSGLDLAEAKATTLVIFPGAGARYAYRLKLDDVGRAMRLVRTLWPAPKGRPAQGDAYGALIRLALQAAEADKTFESKLASRLLAALESAREPTPRAAWVRTVLASRPLDAPPAPRLSRRPPTSISTTTPGQRVR